MDSARAQVSEHVDAKSSIHHASESLEASLHRIQSAVRERAETLCAVIQAKSDSLIQTSQQIISSYQQYYQHKLQAVSLSAQTLDDVIEFSEHVTQTGSESNLLNLHNDVSCRLSKLLSDIDTSFAIHDVKFDVPDKGKGEVYLDRLFGALVQGETVCGQAELLATFTSDLHWPNGLAVTKSSAYLVCGKAGAFQESGKVVCYDRHGRFRSFTYSAPSGELPCAVCVTSHNDVMVSLSSGDVIKLSSGGATTGRWQQCFRGGGGGSMAEHRDRVYVTSCGDKAIRVFDVNGSGSEPVDVIKLHCSTTEQDLVPNHIAINDNGACAFTCLHSKHVYLMSLRDQRVSLVSRDDIHCPSALLFDPFGNLLVADFTADCVHLLSADGWYYGQLLSKQHGISCPNALAFDNDGHLLVAQYGGDVQVLRYRSLLKRL